MFFGLITVSIIILVALLPLFIKKFNNKLYFTVLGLLILTFTIWIGYTKPINHKPFSITIIDYLIKFKNDNSTTIPTGDINK